MTIFPLLSDCILSTLKVNPTIYGFCLFVFVSALFVCRLLKFESISEPTRPHDPDIFERRYSFFLQIGRGRTSDSLISCGFKNIRNRVNGASVSTFSQI